MSIDAHKVEGNMIDPGAKGFLVMLKTDTRRGQNSSKLRALDYTLPLVSYSCLSVYPDPRFRGGGTVSIASATSLHVYVIYAHDQRVVTAHDNLHYWIHNLYPIGDEAVCEYPASHLEGNLE